MIRLTRLNHSPVILNSDLIEIIEVTPDTVITLTTGQKLMVRETAEEVTERVRSYRRSLIEGAFWQAGHVQPRRDQTGARVHEPKQP